MTTVTDTALSQGREVDLISPIDWECLCAGRHNVLLEGPDDSTGQLVRLLEPFLSKPVRWRSLSAAFARPAERCGTLVLQNVGTLGRSDQADLRRWLDDSGERTHVVSTTARALFPLVERGLFDEALYYRLSVMLFCVGPGDTSP